LPTIYSSPLTAALGSF